MTTASVRPQVQERMLQRSMRSLLLGKAAGAAGADHHLGEQADPTGHRKVLVMGLAVYTLIAHHAGGYVYRAVFSLGVGTFVLWALYGNDESDRFFRSTP